MLYAAYVRNAACFTIHNIIKKGSKSKACRALLESQALPAQGQSAQDGLHWRGKDVNAKLRNCPSTSSSIDTRRSGLKARGISRFLEAVLPSTAQLILNSPAKRKSTPGRFPVLPSLLDDVQEKESELLQAHLSHQQSQKLVLLGIDPDNNGAAAIIQLDLSGDFSMLDLIKRSSVDVYDMPCRKIIRTNKKPRRLLDTSEVVAIVKSLVNCTPPEAKINAIIEQPIPGPLNGVISVYGAGFSFGLWSGALESHDISCQAVSARRWKMELGLNKHGKDGSRALAVAIYPQAEHLLRRKKDHGRAEALLILAWALGIRVPATTETAMQLADQDNLTPPIPEAVSESAADGCSEQSILLQPT